MGNRELKLGKNWDNAGYKVKFTGKKTVLGGESFELLLGAEHQRNPVPRHTGSTHHILYT